MKSFFGADGRQLLEALSFTNTLYAFDFDGTLAKIVVNPDDATLSENTRALLQDLAKSSRVAVISGRSLRDLKPRLPKGIVSVIGNHGLEGLGGGETGGADRLNARWKSILEKKLKAQRDSSLELEDKTYSLALHYRRSRSKKKAKSLLLRWAAELTPSPRIIMGKCVINLVPPGAPHKGVALLKLMQKSNSSRALYIGDDDTDEDVFSLPDERIVSIRVGMKRFSRAQFFLARQSEVNRLLRMIVGFSKKS